MHEVALENLDVLEYYACQLEGEGTAAEQLRRLLDEHPEMMAEDHAERITSQRQQCPLSGVGVALKHVLGGLGRNRNHLHKDIQDYCRDLTAEST